MTIMRTFLFAQILSVSIILNACEHDLLQAPIPENNTFFWEQTNFDSTSITALATNSDGDIFAANNMRRIFRSIDNGDSWTALSGDFEDIVTTLGINQNGDIFAATSNGLGGKLFRSSDKGQTWASLTLPWSMVISEIAFDSRGLVFFVNSGGEEAHATIWRSINNGEHWTNIPLPSVYPVDVEISPNGYLYVATAQGVFRSANGGNTWLSASLGLTSKVVHNVDSDH